MVGFEDLVVTICLDFGYHPISSKSYYKERFYIYVYSFLCLVNWYQDGDFILRVIFKADVMKEFP